ncbi:hypothetical protein ACMFMG_002490 [Clarireedia jacksonii]
MDMLSPSHSPHAASSTRISGKKYPWQRDNSTKEQQKSDTTKNIEKFLTSIKKDPIGPALAKFSAEILAMHNRHDYFMMHVNNKAKKRMVNKRQEMEEYTTSFIDDITKGVKQRLGVINTTAPLPQDFADNIEIWFMKQLQTYQVEMKKRSTRATSYFTTMDSKMREKHKIICKSDNAILLEQLEVIKEAQDSAIESYILALKEAASAQGVNIDPILAAVPVAVAVSCSAPSTPTAAANPIPTISTPSNEYRRNDSSGSKRRRLQDHCSSEN